MPVVVIGPYPTVEEVMNLARAIVNDSYNNGAGRILTDDAPFTLPYLNSAIRKLRMELANNSVSTVIKDNVILTPLTPVAQVDPSVQTFVSWTGYFDGTNMNDAPVLPPDLIVPIVLWERQTGTNLAFQPMCQPMQGLCSREQSTWLREWEWRTDQLNFVGSVNSIDVRLRYEAQTLVPVAAGSDFTTTIIGSIDSQDALAYEVAYMFASARGAATTLKNDRDNAVYEMVNRYVRRMQDITYIREQFGSNGNAAWPGGNADLP